MFVCHVYGFVNNFCVHLISVHFVEPVLLYVIILVVDVCDTVRHRQYAFVGDTLRCSHFPFVLRQEYGCYFV